MHPNPIFHKTDRARSLAFARERGFGVLAVSAEGAPHLSHVPFLLSEDGTSALLHLVRSNPIARTVRAATPARLDVLGPDGYVSPDWYGIDDQVPTWNYVAVHLLGQLHPMPPESIEEVLEAQSAAYEGRLDKRPWTMDKMSGDAKARMLRQILPFRLEVTGIDATWKLGQNKPDEVRKRAAGHARGGLGNDLGTLANLMDAPPDLTD
ncbi:FMN-binding negative transcriptional regulator [Aestuariicoccus sp. MJ-SS9]|uniref:FMN-binding negative transcriptional regulator n=1 Tax=Aestuariicoccus sp. MJ-SS9 TaxID=3079855 RepID=UPI002912B431|nr:FMN-binding negative transcriptional regulator [Aestuariicoccus sp. MJ-SS9]MDU8909751.1 FMN-binding negative transcriptional regulator [Aestuariicoccus sp. MJ-SS9]